MWRFYLNRLGCAVLCFVILTVCKPSLSFAQTATDEEIDIAHWAYASQLGTGLYKTSDRTVQVYNLPFFYKIRSLDDHEWGLRFDFPLTLGFFDFKARDIVDSGLPEDVSTLSLIPGLEFQIPLSEIWTLKPFTNIGFGKDFSGGNLATIYSAGLQSLSDFDWKSFTFGFGIKLLYTGYDVVDSTVSDSYWSIETGLDLKPPFHFTIKDHKVDLSLYFINFRYLEDLVFFNPGTHQVNVVIQNEVGFTIGTKKIAKIGFMKIPRIGLGYRFGNSLTVIRLILGRPF